MSTTTDTAPADTTTAPAEPATGTPTPAAPARADTDWKAEAERIAGERDEWKRRSRQHEDRSKQRGTEAEQQAAVLRQVAEKVGVPWSDDPDPAALTAKLAEQTSVARARTVELAVFRSASTAGADASALLDSRGFMDKAGALDPESPDFAGRLAELVTEAAQSPRYRLPDAEPADDPAPVTKPTRAKPPAPASGSNGFGSPPRDRLWSQGDYDRALAGGDMDAINKAIDAGLLTGLGIGKRKGVRR